ncbi:hypothetical protein A4A49_07162 [Nicotiana attenuata]|uniref:Uncharacterized protein n=1 Tax=Nicotiana attenuata TaxID=49451 RepID=A0A1J6IT71_NICAT|nr:hypothetical protein A4A49_07162 [Nicotiana attenuata]
MTTTVVASVVETNGNISTVNNSMNSEVVEENRMSKDDNGKSKIHNDCVPSSSNVTIIEKAQSIAHANENSQKLEADKDPVAPVWANLFARNRVASNGLALSYIPPTIVDGSVVIQLDPTETAKEADKWKHSLIVAVISEIPGYNHMKRFISQNWTIACSE